VAVFDLRESMRNGGGPACLRLRVADERRTLSAADGMGGKTLCTCGELLREVYQALDELTQILRLGAVYDFQR
jgi:succinylarginine dihydrolase